MIPEYFCYGAKAILETLNTVSPHPVQINGFDRGKKKTASYLRMTAFLFDKVVFTYV